MEINIYTCIYVYTYERKTKKKVMKLVTCKRKGKAWGCKEKEYGKEW